MTARLHVLLGQGGVGKTTLAAALGLALARRGRRAGLLGIDPAGRLRDALGMTALPELPVEVPFAPGLRAALLRPGDSLRRWAAQERAPEPLLQNPFFLALADRLAAAAAAFAAVRVAEWAEVDPALDDLVVDTAPGLHGLEFLGKPDRLLSLLSGRLLRWLSVAAHAAHPEQEARRVLRGLSRIAGARVFLDLAEFSVAIERVAASIVRRLEAARSWLRAGSTELLLVCVARAGAADAARALAAELRAMGLESRAVLLNRALPQSLLALPPDDPDPESRAFRRFVAGSVRLQESAARELASFARVLRVPMAGGLDAEGPARLQALEALGGPLLDALESGR